MALRKPGENYLNSSAGFWGVLHLWFMSMLLLWRERRLSETAVRRLRELEKDNVRLKRLLAERDLEVDVLKESLQKK